MRLLAFALVVTAVGAGSALACDKDKATSATAAGTSGSKDVADCCATKGAASGVKFASAKGAKGKVDAAFAGESCAAHKGAMGAMAAGHKCDGHGMVMQGMASHADCSACEDMANCQSDLEAAGARAQVVSLKNGVMYVYTAESPDRVRAIQAAVARRNSRMLSAVTAADKARLCSECKLMRGAMASGKLSREVVNVETGCLTLVTSNDRAMIEKIHAMAGPQLAVRVKS